MEVYNNAYSRQARPMPRENLFSVVIGEIVDGRGVKVNATRRGLVLVGMGAPKFLNEILFVCMKK